MKGKEGRQKIKYKASSSRVHKSRRKNINFQSESALFKRAQRKDKHRVRFHQFFQARRSEKKLGASRQFLRMLMFLVIYVENAQESAKKEIHLCCFVCVMLVPVARHLHFLRRVAHVSL